MLVSFVKSFLWLKCVWIEKSFRKILTNFSFFDCPLFLHSASFTWRLTTKSAPTLHEQRPQPIRLKYANSGRFLVQWEALEGGTSLKKARWVKHSERAGKPGLTSDIPEDWNTWKQWLIRGGNLQNKSLILSSFEVKRHRLCNCDISTSAYIKSTL